MVKYNKLALTAVALLSAAFNSAVLANASVIEKEEHQQAVENSSITGHASRQLKKAKKGAGSSSKAAKKAKKASYDDDEPKECGTDYCQTKAIRYDGMTSCLKEDFDHLDNLFFPEDADDGYSEARLGPWGYQRWPAAIVYVEDTEEVQTALACARDNGYKVSARGRNHSYQSLGTMDGYVVIDMTLTCKPDEFVVDKDDQGPLILEGSKYVGTIKAQAGCTNAVMLAAGDKHFRDEHGMTIIGACPSVGITGFVLGGGAGDITPYVGLGADIIKEFEMVMYDGTVVRASAEENADLFWASGGGGGGNGIITHLTYKIAGAPEPRKDPSADPKYTALQFHLFTAKPEEAASLIQGFFYDDDPNMTGRFGGGLGWEPNVLFPGITMFTFSFTYLGSLEEALDDLKSSSLFKETYTVTAEDIIEDDLIGVFAEHPLVQLPPFFQRFPFVEDAQFTKDYDVICEYASFPCSEMGELSSVSAVEFDTYAEMQAFRLCIGGFSTTFLFTRTTGDLCSDLGLPADKCTLNSSGFISPKSCIDKDVISAILEKAEDPSSFMNSHGPSPEYLDSVARFYGIPVDDMTVSELYQWWVKLMDFNRQAGSTLLPKLDNKLFVKMVTETSEVSNHLLHGAPLLVDHDAKAYPWRDAAFQIDHTDANGDESASYFNQLSLDNGHNPQGYYAYLGPFNMQNWRSFYFGTHWRKLSEIRGKYDPLDLFGKPLTIESIAE